MTSAAAKPPHAAALVIKLPRLSALVWLAAPLCACGFLVWVNVVRIQHVGYVSAQGGWEGKSSAATGTAPSASELAPGNGLIIPEHLTESYHWIAQTQRMFNREEWRVRHIDYENAPYGRTVDSPSPYRWWLGLVAWGDHVFSGRSPAQSVERAALVADPLLHGLLLLGAGLLVAWRFGAFPATLISLGLVIIFPLAAEFLPGAPDDRGLSHLFALGSVLLLVAGLDTTPAVHDSGKSTGRWFFWAGVLGGLGLWVSVPAQAPVLAGVVAGALLAAWIARTPQKDASAVLPWRRWAAGAALATLAGYLIEFFPAHLGGWNLAVIHPLYGAAWLGAGEVLFRVSGWIQGIKFPRTARAFTLLALAILAVAALPVVAWKTSEHGLFNPDLQSVRLTRLPEGAVAPSLGAWMARDGLTRPVVATLLPLLLIAPAVWSLVRRKTGLGTRLAVALALGPVVVALGFACRHLAWWNTLDGLLLVLVVATAGSLPGVAGGRYTRLAWFGFVLLLLSPAVFQIAPRARMKNELSRSEVFGLVERDLASWLALHNPPGAVVVLAPPNETTALCYYGGLRGIGSLSWENKEGAAAAMRILSAPSAQEAKELIDGREITHIIVLSWDSYFDEYARAGSGRIEGTFYHDLRSWKLPTWLRPVAYQLPTITGFEGQSVAVYAVVEDQDEATALGRLADYFVETGELDRAASVAEALRRFPADLGAWVARAEVELARGDEAGFAKSLKLLQARLGTKTPPTLPWDQRVRLAIVLAKAKQLKLAREQVTICLTTADEAKLRMLSTGTLYRLLVLGRAFELTLDPPSSQLALDLLPSDLRGRLTQGSGTKAP